MSLFTIDLLTGKPLLLTAGSSGSGSTLGAYTEFNTFAELPPADSSTGEVYLVREGTGDYVFNRKDSGLYRSDGVQWIHLNNIVPYFSSDNIAIYEASDTGGTTGVKFITSGITQGVYQQLEFQNTGGTIALIENLNEVELQNRYGLTTGIFSGFTLTQTGVDTISIGEGKGIIVDYGINPLNPELTKIEFAGLSNLLITGITSSTLSYISILKDGSVEQKETPFTTEDRRTKLNLGTVTHITSSISETNYRPDLAYNNGLRFNDFLDTFPLIKDNGRLNNQIIPSAGTLSFTKTAGRIMRRSSNYENDVNEPDFLIIPSASPATFIYGNHLDVIDSIGLTELITNEYEDPDTGNIITITGSTNQATVQRFYLFQDGTIGIQRGQKVYDSISIAIDEITFDNNSFKESPTAIENGLLIAAVAIRVGAIDLANRRDAKFFEIDRFGVNVGGSIRQSFIKFQIVQDVGDFPPPDINGFIQLQDNFEYQINGLVNIGDKKLLSGDNTSIFGFDASRSGIITNTSSPLLTGDGNSVALKHLTLINLDTVNGCIFDLSGDENNNYILTDLLISNSKFGELKGADIIIVDTCALLSCDDGLVISGNTSLKTSKVKINNLLVDDPVSGFTGIRIIDTQYDKVNISNNYFFLTSGVTGVTIPANLDVFSGLLLHNEFIHPEINVGTSLSGGVSRGELSWTFKNNTGLQDSQKIGFLTFANNTGLTTISNTTNYFKVNGTNTRFIGERFFSGGTNNRLIYSGGTNAPDVNSNILVTGDLFVDQNNQTIFVSVFLNGVTNIVEREIRTTNANSPEAFALNTIYHLDNGDYVEVFIRNVSQARDITVGNMEFKVTG